MLDTTGATAADLREALTNLARRAKRLPHCPGRECECRWVVLHREIAHLQDELARIAH